MGRCDFNRLYESNDERNEEVATDRKQRASSSTDERRLLLDLYRDEKMDGASFVYPVVARGELSRRSHRSTGSTFTCLPACVAPRLQKMESRS